MFIFHPPLHYVGTAQYPRIRKAELRVQAPRACRRSWTLTPSFRVFIYNEPKIRATAGQNPVYYEEIQGVFETLSFATLGLPNPLARVRFPDGASQSLRFPALFRSFNRGASTMFKGNPIRCTAPPRRRMAIRTVAPASKLSGLTRRCRANSPRLSVGAAIRLTGLSSRRSP